MSTGTFAILSFMVLIARSFSLMSLLMQVKSGKQGSSSSIAKLEKKAIGEEENCEFLAA